MQIRTILGALPLLFLPGAAAQPAPAAPAQPAAPDPAQQLVGKPAPTFTLPDQQDKPRSLSANKNQWVVLAFFPKDMTKGWTLENQSYSASNDKFAARNAVVYTVSTQDTKSKKDFCAQAGLTHTLLSDVGGKTAQAYGVLMPNGMARRVTFFIRPDGTVAGVNTKPSVATAAQDSLAQLAALTKQDEEARRPVGGGAPVRTGERPNQFVGPASARVTMDALVPDFALPDVGTGKNVALTTLSAGKKATVLAFFSARCPVSNGYAARLRELAAAYGPRGVAFAGINSNGSEPAADVAGYAKSNGFTFPILRDAGGVIAERFQAKRTPEVYVLDGKGVLVYHGAIDDSQNAAQVTKRHLALALDAVLAGSPVPVKETPAVGSVIAR